MSTEKEPDFAGIAERLADTVVLVPSKQDLRMVPTAHIRRSHIKQGYASCMEARLRSDWETIRLLRALPHTFKCGVGWTSAWGILAKGRVKAGPCTCGLSAQLSRLLEPFTP